MTQERHGATRNPDFDGLFKDKKRVVLLNKSDLASPALTKAWITEYKKNGIESIEFVATNSAKKKAALELMENAAKEKVEKSLAKGVKKTVRAMIVGIPNVGKSTFINRIAGTNRAQVGDKPGVTKGQQGVKITPYLELMDTPGLLWPKLEDPQLAQACGVYRLHKGRHNGHRGAGGQPAFRPDEDMPGGACGAV